MDEPYLNKVSFWP